MDFDRFRIPFDLAERFRQVADRPELRPTPVGVPRFGQFGKAKAGRFVVVVVGGEPDIIGIPRFEQGKLLGHFRGNLFGRRNLPGAAFTGLDAEVLARGDIVRVGPDKEPAVRVGALPVEEMRQRRIPADVDARAARRFGISGIGKKDQVLDSGVGIGRDQRPGDAVVVDHQHGLGKNIPTLPHQRKACWPRS